MFEIHVRELRATFLRNYSVRHHTGAQAERNSSPQDAQATSRGIMPRRHDRKRPQRPQTRDGPTYAVPGPRIGAQIRQSTPNRMRLSARRPLVAAEFGARGIPVRRAPQLYDQSARARIPWRRASTHTGRAPQRTSSSRPWQREAGPTPYPVPETDDPRERPLPREARTCGTMEA